LKNDKKFRYGNTGRSTPCCKKAEECQRGFVGSAKPKIEHMDLLFSFYATEIVQGIK
jgi:hypothetical protein